LEVKEVEEESISVIRQKKYLIIWSLILGNQELQNISMQPEALSKGLHYVKAIKKRNNMELYRIISVKEITNFEGMPASSDISRSENPNGIAIINARSIEEARKMVVKWVEGLSYGGISIQRYLKYEIKPLMEIGQ
jgi:hypothetical protein